jgi:broad specificity phosphatase PhoE
MTLCIDIYFMCIIMYMGYIFIVRHGPTHKDNLDIITYHNYFVPQIKDIISNYGNISYIYTSPIERCKNTASILAKALNLSDDKIIMTDDLLRFDRKIECSCITKHRTKRFGHRLRSKKENILIVTHSSVIKYILEGISHTKIKKFYVNKGSLTVFDNSKDRFIDFNHYFQ